MLKEVNKAELNETLEAMKETGAHLKQLGELLEERATNVMADVLTMAMQLVDEGMDFTVQIPASLFNAIANGLKELLALINEEGYTHSRRVQLADKVYNDLLAAGLAPLLPPEPSPDVVEQAKEELRAEERARRLASDKWTPPRRY